jgi:hypothetical protein
VREEELVPRSQSERENDPSHPKHIPACNAQILDLLHRKLRDSPNLSDKQRIQELIDTEIDYQAIENLMGSLLTEAARRAVRLSALTFLTKHMLRVAAELKTFDG